jgi:hypothetical protein
MSSPARCRPREIRDLVGRLEQTTIQQVQVAVSCGDLALTGVRPGGGYVGPLSIVISPPPGSSFPTARITNAPETCAASKWSCSKAADRLLCRIADCAMITGEQVTARIDGRVAPELSEPPPSEQKRTVCSVILWQERQKDIDIEQRSGKRTKNACFTTTILARVSAPPGRRPIVCRGGKMLVGDQCTCPTGAIELGGRCVACTGGKVPVQNRCICPPGTLERANRCIQPQAPGPSQTKPLVPKLLCLGGKVPVGNRCVCPQNTIESRGRCVPRQRVPLGQPAPPVARPQARPVAPQFQTVPGRITCPQGTKLIDGKCAPVIR